MRMFPSDPIRPPTCWQYFGFSGPTNKHNLDIRYQERINSITPAGYENAMYASLVVQQYQECLAELATGPEGE